MATLTWTEGAWIGKWHVDQREAWLNAESYIKAMQEDFFRSTVTARKAFLSPWTGCDSEGEGCGERK